MDIKTKKYLLIERIIRINDSILIEKLMKAAETTDWWDKTSEAEKRSIQKGLKDIEENRVVEHTEVKKMYKKYL